MFNIIGIVFLAIAAIACVLIMIGAIRLDKNYDKSYRLARTGLFIVMCDVLLLGIILTIFW